MAKKILVIDDAEDLLELTRRLLESRGYQVIPLQDGDQAMTVIREHRPDLVIMDMLMPGLDGEEICHAIKSEPLFAHLPVIITTGQFLEGDSSSPQFKKADSYLRKPFDPEELLNRVREFLP